MARKPKSFKVSLAEWMIENLGEDEIEKYWSDKNEISPWDISYGSKKTIFIQCQEKDYHEDYDTTPNRFTYRGHRCPYCSSQRIHPKDSFAQWGIDTYGDSFMEKYWSEKNTVSPWEISPHGTTKIYLKCQNTDYHEDYDVPVNNFSCHKNGCPFCGGRRLHKLDSFAQWGVDNVCEDFLEKYWDYEKNGELDPWEISKGCIKKAYIKCQNKEHHQSYLVAVSMFIYYETRCPYCCNAGGKVHPIDSLGSVHPETIELWSNKNKKTPLKYSPKSKQSVYWKCENNKHDDYERMIGDSNNKEFRCPQCVSERDESFLQEKVRLFLTEELNYQVLHEHYCDLKCINPKTNYQLPYDNEVALSETIKIVIEVHGEQHYKTSTWAKLSAKKNGTTPQEELEYIQWKDQFKKDYAISQGYHYLEIPYWTDNEHEEWKQLIIDKLNEIK